MNGISRSLLLAALVAAALVAQPSEAADPFTITAPFATNVLSGCTGVTMSGQATIDSAGLTSTGATNGGNVVSNGNITLSGQATINGNATPGPGKTVQLSGNATVTGTKTSATSAYGCTPIDLTSLATTLRTTNDNARIPHTTKGNNPLSGANHTDFVMSGNDSITLPAGTYYFTTFTLSGGSTVSLGGPVRILTTGSIAFSGGAMVNGGTSPNPFLLHLWGSGSSFALSNSTLAGYVYVPAASAALSTSRLIGSLFADSVTLSGQTHATRTLDDVAPRVAITSPANNSLVSDPSHVVVSGTAFDDQTAVALTVKGQAVSVNADGTWQVTLNLSGAASPATIAASATDVAGNTATASVSVVLVAAPVVTLTSPVTGSVVATRHVNLTGSAGTASTVTVNGQAASVAGGNWSLASFDLGADGTHMLTIVGTNAGGSTTLTASLTDDTAPPIIQATATPAPNAAGWNNTNVTVSFACSDATSGIATCPAPIIVTTEGAGQVITGTAVDKAGNSAQASLPVSIDKTQPHFTFTSFTNNQIVTNAHVVVTGSSDDATQVTVNGLTATIDPVGKTYTSASLTLVEKSNQIVVTGTDRAGNSNTATLTLILDDVAPHVTIDSPVSNSIVADPAHVVVSGTATDDQTSVVSLKVNGQAVTPSPSGAYQITLDLSSGPSPVTITAVATDAAGNTTPASVSVITTRPPIISLTTPASGSLIAKRQVSLAGSAGTATAVTVNGLAATLANGSWTFPNFDLGLDGAHTLTIVGTNAGGSTTITATITNDTIAPTIQATVAPAPNGAGWNNANVTVTFTCTDAGSGVATCPAPINVTTEGAGQIITGTATDKAGNRSTPATVTVNLDKTAPHFTFTSHTDGQIVKTAQVVITGGSDDAVSASVNGSTATIDGHARTFTSPTITLVEKSNQVVVTGKDVADNAGTATISIILDDLAPLVAITSPVSGSVASDPAHVVVTGTASDNETAVSGVKVNGQQATLSANGTYTITLDLSASASPATITAVATDLGGNTATATVSVVTIPPPVLTLTLPPPGSFVATQILTLSGGSGTATSLTVNHQPATLSDGSWTVASFDLGADGAKTLTITGSNAGGSTTITPGITLDTVPPTIQAALAPAPNAAGWNNTNVTVTFACADAGSGIATCPAPVVVSTEAAGQLITGTAVDKAGNSTKATAIVNIDKTSPSLTFTSHTQSQVVSTPQVVITGGSDDAVSVTVGGVAATVDPVGKTFTSAKVTLAEGSNSIVVGGVDRAGNVGSATLTLVLDTRPPQLSITIPAANTCTSGMSVTISGSAIDAHLKDVSVLYGGATTKATVDGSGSWTITIPNLPEGKAQFVVTATDTVGHTATSTLTLNVIRTVPVVDITEGGASFTATLLNRSVSLAARVTSADPNVVQTVTLDGAPFVAGTAITTDGAHTLDAIATDCAGGRGEKRVQFTIDRTPPAISGLVPAGSSTVGSVPASIHGTVSKPATITIAGTNASVTVTTAGAFDITGVSFVEGLNRFTLHAVDLAGNSADIPYQFTLRTSVPAISITDNGTAIQNGAIFNRAVTPVITASATDATITAQLNSQTFTSGTKITADGAYTLTATATDPVGHRANASVGFTIDTVAPVVKITSPADGQTIDADHVSVTGTAGDSTSLTVNGVAVPLLPDGSFALSVPLDLGETPILATGVDRAGNRGSAQIVVTRASSATGVLVTAPTDATTTNRPTTVVSGRILTPATARALTVSGPGVGTPVTVPFDPAGSFLVPDFKLVEGANAITATVTSSNGKSESATVHVTVDLTPPTVTILASAQQLDDNAHFAAAVTLSVSVSDLPAGNPAPSVSVLLDGAAASLPVVVSASGSHSVVATATDAAGNQTRVRRSFSIGAQAATGCGLTTFDPADGSIVAASSVTVAGQSGGAVGVKLNGIPARVDNGSFAGTVELTTEGTNSVSIVCTDAAGNPTGSAATIHLVRVTSNPTVTIDSPSEMAIFGAPSVTVSGTIGAGVTAVDVNGAHATITGLTYTATAVPLSGPLTMLVAHATNAAGRLATASRRVVYLKDPPSLSINWPSDGFTTGSAGVPPAASGTIDVSGTYTNVDPTSIATPAGGTLETHVFSDTTGSFTIHNVPLTQGAQQLTISGHDLLNRTTSATVNVAAASGAPSIAIAAPANNSYAPGSSVAVSGTFISSGTGSQVDVGGSPATIAGNTFSGSGALGTSGSTAVVVRLTQPDGSNAIATAFVTQLSGAPTVKQSFPAAEATSVDAGVIVLVSFSAPMDRGSLNDGFVLLDGSGAPITGQLRLDRDVLSFAPATSLTPGQRYTIDIRTTAKDLAGNAVGSEVKSSFTIATTAPSTPPVVDPITSPICGNQLTLSGTAPASARIEIDLGGVPQFTTADAMGHFSLIVAIPSQTGFRVARVRVLGADGSYSPAAEATFEVGCGAGQGSGVQVTGATYDRNANTITVSFSAPIDLTTATVGPTGTIQLQLTDGTPVTGTVAPGTTGAPPAVIVITPGTPDPRALSLTLAVSTSVKDATGQPIGSPFTTTFTISGGTPTPNDGSGYISGQILDATNGRPLPGATVTTNIPVLSSRGGRIASASRVEGQGSRAEGQGSRAGNTTARSAGSLPAGPPAASRRVSSNSTAANTVTTNPSGQYTAFVPEGAYTIHAYGSGYTDVWRQVVVPAGTGIIPIDIRLGARGVTATAAGSDLHLTHGGDTTVTRKATLTVASASIPTGTSVTLTAVGSQSLAGLLPLGWSPIASAEVHVGAPSGMTFANAAAQLAFDVPASDITAAARTLTAVEYDSDRDQWRVIQPVVSISGTSATITINLPATVGAYALVYADQPGSAGVPPAPPAPVAGGILAGVTDPCLTTTCAPLSARGLNLNPSVVLPSDRSVATLVMNAAVASSGPTNLYPSGTAVQAYINEELRLVDGTVAGNQPFSADLILYRTLAGDTATADFHIAPSADAARLQLQTGFEHLQVFPYPGRLDRGTLVGPAGGQVPSDETVQVAIPSGATAAAVHATASSIKKSDLPSGIAGFDVLAGFNFTLDAVAGSAGVPPAAVALLKPATASFTIDTSALAPQGNAAQLIVVEVLQSTAYGRVYRLADTMNALQPIDATAQVRVSSALVDPSKLPVDGIVRAGQYLLLLAKQPIAYAFGGVRLGASGPYANGALVTSGSTGVPPAVLGVTDVSRLTGLFALPVVSAPAAPFTLTPNTPPTGDGSPFAAATAPAAGAFVAVGDLVLVAQPPVLQHVNVIGTSGTLDLVAPNAAQNVSLATTVQALFSQSIDPASVTATSITVANSGTGQTVPSTTTVAGSTLTWTPGSAGVPPAVLAPNSTYIITIASTLRGSHGAPLNTSPAFAFSTVTVITSSQIHPEKIHITIPNASGVATISGDPGAFPTVPPEVKAWRALALRRGTAFLTQYQVTAAADGSFSFPIGTCGGATPCADAVSLTDHIDLEILNAADNIAAILPLGPFVSADGKAFVAQPTDDTTFTSSEGVTIHVAPGSFDQPTVVRASKLADASPFAGVPNFSTELNYYTGVQIDLDCSAAKPATDPTVPTAPCRAKTRLDVSLPLPAGVNPSGKNFLLGWLGDSVRGPRIMVVDTMRIDGGNVTTAPLPGSAIVAKKPTLQSTGARIGSMEIITGNGVKSALLGVNKSGIYNVIDLHVPTGSAAGWAVMDGIQGNYDLFWDQYSSLFASHTYLIESPGRVVIPVILTLQFQLVGVDAGTGIQAFSKVYAPLPLSDPGAAFVVDTPATSQAGPYPVFALPNRIEVVDLTAENEDIVSVRGFSIRLQGGNASVVDVADVADKLPAGVEVTLLNVTSGQHDATRSDGLSVPAKLGDRLVLVIGQIDVDPETSLSVVFNRAVHTEGASPADIDAYLNSVVSLQRLEGTSYVDVSSAATFSVDSSGRRLKIDVQASLQRGATYRVTLSGDFAAANGSAPGLKIGQILTGSTTTGGIPEGLRLYFTVRQTASPTTSFDLRQNSSTSVGGIRDMSLNGNVLLISAGAGGILAYDAANPRALSSSSLPLGYVQPGSTEFWAVASDQHGRVYATGIDGIFGFVQSYRLSDFIGTGTTPKVITAPRSSTTVAWVPGYSSGADLGDTVLSDRPEGLPRKLQLAVQDSNIPAYAGVDAFLAGVAVFGGSTTVTNAGDFKDIQLTIPIQHDAAYRTQRITVQNVTRDLRWSGDATDLGPAVIHDIVARPNDQLLLVINERTYGIVTIFGYGVGVFDLNAVESNALASPPSGYQKLSERVVITKGELQSECPGQDPSNLVAIPDLSLSAETAVVPRASSSKAVLYGVDVHKGILDLRIDLNAPPPAPGGVLCNDRQEMGMLLTPDQNPRIATLESAFHAASGRTPFRHFNGVQTYEWTLEAADNQATAPPSSGHSAPGQRGSVAGMRVVRDYLLVPGFEYGLLVIDATVPPGFLTDLNLADIIWIPGGAVGVRVIPRTHYATVVDRNGRVLLVDLSRIDERWNPDGTMIDDSQLFKTVSGALCTSCAGIGTPDPLGVGAPDPRIVWTSAPGLVTGSLAPVIDTDTGILFAGQLEQKTTSVLAISDPRVEMMVDTGNGTLSEVSGIVPLGIDPPSSVKITGPNGSLAAFRLALTLPGGLDQSLTGGQFRVAVESERVAGAPISQTPPTFPRAHLRATLRDGSTDPRGASGFSMTRDLPPGMDQALRIQKGYNKFISPWIVALADPRASIGYDGAWPAGADKAGAGCMHCDRPQRLQGLTEAQGVYELWSGGRVLSVRPEACGSTVSGCSGAQTIFDGTPYEYLARNDRLTTHFATIMADTVRTPAVLTAAQAPAVAGGAVEETVALHSGELQTSHLDLSAGGRAGWNVEFDRTHRGRTMVPGLLGRGWASSIFRRLRALPSGNVEYRDGTGEVWLFKPPTGTGPYQAPTGLSLSLIRTDDGWQLVDLKRRVSTFDSMGRLVTESDEFGGSGLTGSGNTIRYLYDPKGQLVRIVDPVSRESKLAYWDDGQPGWKAGRLETITDWRGRTVDFDYDGSGRLLRAALPAVNNSDGVPRPTIQYGYDPTASAYNDDLELGGLLRTITDPSSVASSTPRITFSYGSDADRGKVKSQTWATGETVSFSYASAAASVIDALAQTRNYTLTAQPSNYSDDRAHVATLKEVAVPVASIPFGGLPVAVSPSAVTTSPVDRTSSFSYSNGMLQSSSLDGVVSTTVTYNTPSGAAGPVPASVKTQPLAPIVPSMPPSASAPIERDFNYQTGPTLSTPDPLFLQSVSANGVTIDSPEPHRGNMAPSSSNDSVNATSTYQDDGLLHSAQSSGGTDTDTSGAGSNVTIQYRPADSAANDWERALPSSITEGASTTTIAYPDRDTVSQTDPRNITTTTKFDEWQRPIDVLVSGAELSPHETYAYDANGWLRTRTRQQGSRTVRTTYSYDLMGRLTSSITDNYVVDGVASSKTTSVAYDLPHHTITTTISPVGPTTTQTLDPLGRLVSSETATGTTPILMSYAYDQADNRVFQADNFVAMAAAFDAHGRRIAELYQDGTKKIIDHDAWGRANELTSYDSGGTTVTAHTKLDIQPAGDLKSLQTDVETGLSRSTDFLWDGGGRTTYTGVKPSIAGTSAGDNRAAHQVFDTASRLVSAQSGAGSGGAVTDSFSTTQVTSYTGGTSDLPAAIETMERGSIASFVHKLGYDTAANVTSSTLGTLSWQQHFDEAGNVVSSTPPARGTTTANYDGRGAATDVTEPANPATGTTAGTSSYKWSSIGAPKNYTDASAQSTATDTDLAGRPLKRVYADSTIEQFTWNGPRLASYTDRQGRTQAFGYNDLGQLNSIRDGAGAELDHITYDTAGRIQSWANRDSLTEYLEFDLDGHPKRTRQTRYQPGTGLGSKVVLDVFEQRHTWNVHGERTSWQLPRYTGFVPANGWTDTVFEDHDAAGNLVSVSRTFFGGVSTATPLMSATFRNAGRPTTRSVTTTCAGTSSCAAASIVRAYGYDSTTSQLNEMKVTVGGLTVAGTHVGYEGLQINDIQLLGVSGEERHTRHTYDSRGRLAGSIYGTTDPTATPIPGVPGAAAVNQTQGDFVSLVDRTPKLDAATRSLLATKGIDLSTIDPGPMTLGEAPGHKLASVTKDGATSPVSMPGSQRTEDARYLYQWDEKGRLTSIVQKQTSTSDKLRRISYYYDGNDRVIGRRAESATWTAPLGDPSLLIWQLESRDGTLAADGLPADTTFAWDPISDTLVEVFKAGSSMSTDANGGLLRQVLHGGLTYDDPIETTLPNPATPASAVLRLYPVFDEAGDGSLQAALNVNGEVVSRNVPGDASSGETGDLAGGAIDRVSVKATKDSTGAVQSVVVSVRSTETLAAATVATGLRLATVDANGTVVRTSAVTPATGDAYTASFTLTGAQWTALTDPTAATSGGPVPQALSIAVTSSLRAQAWSSGLPILPPPDWAQATKPVFSSPGYPVEVRESLTSLATFVTGLASSATDTRKLYEINALSLAASAPGGGGSDILDQVLASRFQALPFSDPATGMIYVRNRWYDPSTGSFLTPDRLGYGDSSNLYTFGAGDPVNHRDPAGDCINPLNAKCRADMAHAVETAGIYAEELNNAAARTFVQFNVGAIEGVVNLATAGQYNGVKHALQQSKIRVPHSIKEANEVAQNINDAQLHGMGQFVTFGTLDRSLQYLQEEGGSGWKQPLVALDERIGYSEMDTGVKHMLAGEPMGAAEFSGGFAKLTGTAAGVLGFSQIATAPRPTPLPSTLNTKEINFMQSSIRNETGEFTVTGNAGALADGTLSPTDLPTIRVWRDPAGKIWTLDHRRLGAFRLGGVDEVPVEWASQGTVENQMRKMTTKTGGASIKLKLGSGKSITIK